MAAAVPFIAEIVVRVVVSKVASKVATKIGFSDDMANLIGVGVGMYAGGAAGNAASAAVNPTNPAPGMDLSSAMDGGMDLAINAPPPTVGGPAPAAPVSAENLSIGSAPGASEGLAIGGQGPAQSGGMLTQGLGGAGSPAAPPSNTVGTPGGSTSDRLIEGGTTVGKAGSGDDSWWGKLFSPEKTMDLAMAGLAGAGRAGIAKEQLEYPEKVAKQNAQGWAAGDPNPGGFSSINRPN